MIDADTGEYFISLVHDGDFGSIVAYESVMSSLNFKQGKNAGTGIFEKCGFSVEIERNGMWVFGYSSIISKEELSLVVDKLYKKLNTVDYRMPNKRPEIPSYKDHIKPRWAWDPRNADINDKVSQLAELGHSITDSDGISADISYTDLTYDMHIFNTSGSDISYSCAYPSLNVNMFGNSNTNKNLIRGFLGYNSGKNLLGSGEAMQIIDGLKELLRGMESNKGVIRNGKYDIVLDSRAAATLLHESLGHMSEADKGDTQRSAMKAAVGTRVLSQPINVFDDPSIEGLYGSYPYDWEGIKARKKTLVREGMRAEYIHSIETASYFDVEPNGGARAETYANRPIPRMSNIYIDGGTYKDDIIEDLHEGVMLFGSKGARVDPSTGNFVLYPSYSRLLSSGELGSYVNVSHISGNVFDILSSIDAVGTDKEIHPSFCSKDDSLIHMSGGSPKIRIRGVNVYV